ncbi:MAG: ketosteroid isomerase-like protein [Verrucomicrobiales bacterium]|jgi:ketosteroid isomerase-like protein
MSDALDQVALVSAANAEYYDAFERQHLDVLASIWEHSERTTCTHPGWASIHGTKTILESYAAIFRGPQSLQVILTDEHVMVEGRFAYVSVDENLVDQSGNASASAALNIFVSNGERWDMLVHHASPIVSR